MALLLTAAHTVQANSRSAHCPSLGSADVTTRHFERSTLTVSTSCTRRPPSIERTSSEAPYGGGPVNTRRFFFSLRIDSASSSMDGATMTSVNTAASASASPAGTVELSATTPPKALTGSHALALTYASVTLAPTATPQGLACLTITHAGLSRRCTSRHAASVS